MCRHKVIIIYYSLRPILLVADLVLLFCSKPLTSNMGRREYYLNIRDIPLHKALPSLKGKWSYDYLDILVPAIDNLLHCV
jgi:hypothetical protein